MCGHWSIWMISKKPLPDWNKDVILVTLFVFSSVSKGWILGVSKVQGSKNSLPRKWELWLKNQIILTFSSLKFNFGVCASMHITQVMTPKSFWLYSQDFRISYSKWQRSWKKIFTHCDPTPFWGKKGPLHFHPHHSESAAPSLVQEFLPVPLPHPNRLHPWLKSCKNGVSRFKRGDFCWWIPFTSVFFLKD